jgi:hypothetical protein
MPADERVKSTHSGRSLRAATSHVGDREPT